MLQLRGESLSKEGLSFELEMPPGTPPPPNETEWAPVLQFSSHLTGSAILAVEIEDIDGAPLKGI